MNQGRNMKKEKFSMLKVLMIILVALFVNCIQIFAQNPPSNQNYILTPKPSASPRINGAKVFGVRPGHPLIFTISATGDQPITFSAEGLPDGLKLDKVNGQISGSVSTPGTFVIKLKAANKSGISQRELRICVGDRIALTPPMGWNSYNVYGIEGVNQQLIEQSAKAMVASGLINHGWSYLNVDGGWQGYKRGGKYNAILPDETRFPDIQGLINNVHDLGLKFGIYHMAYMNTYDGRIGASSNDPSGKFMKFEKEADGRKVGKYLFHWNDVQQFAKWGVDYLKYDWWIRNLPHAIEMGDALKNANRDIVYSVCNGAAFTNGNFLQYPEAEKHAIGLSYVSNLWRSGNDTEDSWKSVVENGFTQNRWRKLTGPGHWNDPDMLLLGWIGWGKPHPTSLSPDEQYSHMSLWCLMAAPLFIGCDLTKMDDFTLGLLTNDEVIEVNQDPLGIQGEQIQLGSYSVALVKDLEDGSKAVGFFNLGNSMEKFQFNLSDIGISGKQKIRDLWRQMDTGEFENVYSAEINPHGVVFVKITPVKN